MNMNMGMGMGMGDMDGSRVARHARPEIAPQGDLKMEKYLLAPLLIHKLGQSGGFRSCFAWLLKGLAIVGALAALVVFFLGWKDLFDMSSAGMTGGIIYQLTFVAAAYVALHCTWLRAKEISASDSPKPAALPVASVILKLLGEAWGFSSALLGSGAAVYVWFAGRDARMLLDRMRVFFPFLKAGPDTFFSGAALIIQGLLYGALALLLGYLLSELLQLLPVATDSEKSDPEQ
jgi:hypothetical protein